MIDSPVIRLRFESALQMPAAQVWDVVSRMSGVNVELMPLMRMTCPAEYRERSLLDAPLSVPLFACWLLLFGVVPIDRHYLMLERTFTGEGFDERSHSWSNRVWVHRRRVVSAVEGCRVVDELEFEPRVLLMSSFLKAFVSVLFRHRHRVLQRRFGKL